MLFKDSISKYRTTQFRRHLNEGPGIIFTIMSGCLHHEPVQEVFDPPAEGQTAAHGAAACEMALNHQDTGTE